MSNLTVENVYTRHNAKQLTRQHFWKLLGMTLTVGAICVAIMAAGFALLFLATGGPWSSTAHNVAANGTIYAFLLGWIAVIIIAVLISSCLSLGLTSAMLELCRGDETVTVARVFCRMKYSLKSFGLSLWIALKVFLWALPVYAIIGFVGFGIAAAGDPANAQTIQSTAGFLLMILPLLAFILIFALLIPACFRYMLSAHVLADEPSTGIRACVSQSKAMMKGHKWQAFKLVVPLILIMYAILFGLTLVISLILSATGVSAVIVVISPLLSILSSVVSLYFSIRCSMCFCLFYLKRREEQNPSPADESAE